MVRGLCVKVVLDSAGAVISVHNLPLDSGAVHDVFVIV